MWVRALLLNIGTRRNIGPEQNKRGITRQARLRMAGRRTDTQTKFNLDLTSQRATRNKQGKLTKQGHIPRKACHAPAKSKRGREEGDGTENVINCRKLSQIVVTNFMTNFMTNCMTFYDVLCQWNKETEIVIKCRKLSCTPLCATSVRARRPPARLLRRSSAHWLSPGEFGKLSAAMPKSAGPTLGVHSACACHAARIRVQEIGPHSSELAVLLAKE